MSRLRSTVSVVKIPRPSGHSAIPRRARCEAVSAVTSAPSKRILPDATGVAPAIVRISVVLPAPFAPRQATASPASTLTDTPRSASTLP